MRTKLFLAAAVAALSLGAGVAQADTKATPGVTEATATLQFANYRTPYYYYRNHYFKPRCYYNVWNQYVCPYM